MTIRIKSPLTGKSVAITEVPDPVFAQKMMGDGVAIVPVSNEVIAPVSGSLTTVFPTGHAYGIESDEGVEVLIHIGVNTVELRGEHFDVKVKQGDRVEAGDILAVVDFEAIEKAGYPIITPIIITNSYDFESIIPFTEEDVTTESLILELEKAA